jgi:hypothetical protein
MLLFAVGAWPLQAEVGWVGEPSNATSSPANSFFCSSIAMGLSISGGRKANTTIYDWAIWGTYIMKIETVGTWKILRIRALHTVRYLSR